MNGTLKNTYANTNSYEEKALFYLPIHIGNAIRKNLKKTDSVAEIRLVTGAEVTVLTFDGNVVFPGVCTREDMLYTVRSLSGNSVYSHSETVKEGFITTSDGIRAGVCGRAVTDKGKITAVCDITSAVIRIPHRVQGAADELSDLMKGLSYRGSILVYSPPGGGKTTLLREFAAETGQDPNYKRVTVVDSRCELAAGLDGINLSVLSGYPRHKGIEIAVRTLASDIVICDEISTAEDVEAALECLGSGVTLVASVHGTFEDLFKRPVVTELHRRGLFKAYYGIVRKEGGFGGKITFAKDVTL